MSSGFVPSDLARRLFTPGQLRGIMEFMQAPEDAVVYAVLDGKVLEVYKRSVRIEGSNVYYLCAPAPDAPLIPGVFQLGVNAFDSELRAVRAARQEIAQQIAYYLAMGEEIAARERELTRRNPTDDEPTIDADG